MSAENPKSLPIDKTEAEIWNRDLMEAFHQALERDPTTDLLSIVSKRYVAAHRVGQYANLSEAARLNFETVDQLQDRALSQPEANLREIFPADYDRLFKWAMPKDEEKVTPTSSQPSQQLREPLDWLRKKVEPVHTASIIYPLSTKASTLLNQHPASDGSAEKPSLIEALKYRLLNSEIIFELSVRRGAVLRCDDLVIKTFSSNRDLTEYHNLQYLAENVPDLPIPKPHGLIILGSIGVMLMSYVPGTALSQIWSQLSHQGKLSIQEQLNGIFSRLRSLRQEDGTELGGVRGEGVKDYRVMETLAFKGITTARGFDELQFSANHCASPSYVKLLRSFLNEDNKMLEGSVFTHGDLKKSNIMVQEDPENAGFFVVTGIIDWEDGGFYPEYYESTTLSNGQSIMSDDDWYLYAPDCISALRFPVRWLVDRLWGNLLWNWRIDIVR
ncbi:unnamed protein product [Penicillium salamii]|uniref:Aminoglycoside phosphotransferase domain-containing protein n=1 Tax=Penicillium salamii TaxID=1612424 RepID=A0A9W4JKY7_9EURO|nr:unnamed protein product [Penicillium salamii]CAG8122883.1 unnamed protein product [Penicillium salamii]CAG8132171.1 unnamed protein product [Penicillium salamii]CAG8157781.1 unnamed protein product [Penicillium salamii]CAG8187224.1 unnamed protein product [Penicillium salamii]